MSEPWFWRGATPAARLVRAGLAPAAALYDAGQRLRWRLTLLHDVGVPVICVGNASVGGTGKTPFCLMLQRLLAAEGIEAQFLARGYGGSIKGPISVNAQHTADEVGDEAVLLARAAPTWVSRDRAAGAAAAARSGAKLLIMDDGFQNLTLKKALSMLLLAGDEAGLAQFPAGPMREPVTRAAERADAVVVSEPPQAIVEVLRKDIPVFRVVREMIPSISPRPVVAFCGIANAAQFFDGLARLGFDLKAKIAFADHQKIGPGAMMKLRAEAKFANATLMTTEKDFVRLAPDGRESVYVARLALHVDNPAALVRLVRERTGL